MKIKMLCDWSGSDVWGTTLCRIDVKKGDVLTTDEGEEKLITHALAAKLLNNGSAYWAEASDEALANAERECERRIAESRPKADAMAKFLTAMTNGEIAVGLAQQRAKRPAITNPATPGMGAV